MMETTTMEHMNMTSNTDKSSTGKAEFPFQFLLRYSWPEHIDKQIRRLLWLWLSEAGEAGPSEEFDRLGGYVCWMIVKCPESPAAVLDLLAQQD
ncbi:MAG: hypothetical protein ACRD3W_31210, partial [Terriglobales bacterium]